jgi:hypothetical protein
MPAWLRMRLVAIGLDGYCRFWSADAPLAPAALVDMESDRGHRVIIVEGHVEPVENVRRYGHR